MRVLKPLAVGGVATILACAIGFQLSLLGSVLPVVAWAIPLVAATSMAAAVLLQRPGLVTSAAGLLLLSYGLVLIGRTASGLAISTVGLAAGSTFLTLQLGWWAVELRTPVHEDPSAIRREAARIGAAAVAVALAAELAVLLTRIQVGAGITVVIVGVVSLSAIVVVAAVLARSPATSSTRGTFRVGGAGLEPSAPHGRPGDDRSRVLGWVRRTAVGSPLTPSRSRSRQGMTATTGLSLLLLGAAALVVLSALGSAAHPTSPIPGSVRSVDIAAAVELGVLLAGAIVLNWLVRLLMQLSRPQLRSARPVPRRSEPPETPPELDLIRHACRTGALDARLTGDLQSLLASLATQLGEPSLVAEFANSRNAGLTADFRPAAPKGSLRPRHPETVAKDGQLRSEVSVRTALEALEAYSHG